ncbi:hypothetical protein F5X68DRAFT_272806 [Plectosphaerella plurivora]|uniref:Uncharacterized protein n=1 Tax=Plectosphaerella plurivora TaxID=936078 RepID=A0A9P8VL20_9PEZI|nr:hypothetical protein F5X68DRAFT_272806 [Plectosphaerella plurivora]
MQIKTAAVVLALLSSALAAPAPGTRVRTLSRRSDGRVIVGRQTSSLPPPIPWRCAELEEQCDCSRIPKDDIEGWFQCTTNWQCEWCAGLWTDEPEDEEEKEGKPEKPNASELPTRGRDLLWK